MEYSCKILPKNIFLIISIILHILILLLIISTFYFLFIANVAKKSFQNELKHAIYDNMISSIRKSDKNGEIKKNLKEFNLEKLKEHFKKADDITNIQNDWLVKVNYGTAVGVFILLCVTVFILYFSCGNVPYSTILLENIILFILIGAVEVVFFLYVGRKFIPTKPSLIMKTFIESVDKNLN